MQARGVQLGLGGGCKHEGGSAMPWCSFVLVRRDGRMGAYHWTENDYITSRYFSELIMSDVM